jgi:hypothetical protein
VRRRPIMQPHRTARRPAKSGKEMLARHRHVRPAFSQSEVEYRDADAHHALHSLPGRNLRSTNRPTARVPSASIRTSRPPWPGTGSKCGNGSESRYSLSRRRPTGVSISARHLESGSNLGSSVIFRRRIASTNDVPSSTHGQGRKWPRMHGPASGASASLFPIVLRRLVIDANVRQLNLKPSQVGCVR